jgi:Spy/CpxP family protein refolding chaperone
MNTHDHRTHSSLRRYLGVLTAAGLLALTISLMGCSGAESETESTVLGSAAASNTEDFNGPTPPTFAEILEHVDVDQEQQQLLESAYNVWAAAIQSRQDKRQTEGRRGPGKRGREFDGEPPAELADQEPPVQAFLITCSNVLTSEQFIALVNYLAEYQKAQREAMAEQREARFAERGAGMGEGRGGRGGIGGPGGPGGEFMDELNLTEVQQAALEEAREQHRETVQALIEAAGGPGQLDEATRAKLDELRQQMKQTLENILTAEQLAQLAELRETRQAETAERRDAMFTRGAERITDFLAQVLDLDDTQKQQIIEVMTGAQAKIKALHESAREADTPREDLRDQMDQIRDESKTAIRALLSEEQAAAFDALSNLLPHSPGGRMARMMKR